MRETSDVKAARTFPCEEIDHYRGIRRCREYCWRFEKCDKRSMRLHGQELYSLVTTTLRVWRTAERGEWTTKSKGNSAAEMCSVERVKWICEVLCSSPVLGLWARSTAFTYAWLVQHLYKTNGMWNKRYKMKKWIKCWVIWGRYYYECSVFSNDSFKLFYL